MNKVRIRSFTVPNGSSFVCVPQDGSGPLIAPAGAQVTIVISDTWERTVEALKKLNETDDGDPR